LTPSFERDVNIGPFRLENGDALREVVQRVTCYGEPRGNGANVVLVPHALTGSSRVADWWDGIVGPGRALDTRRLAVVGVNALGGCYGSTGPASLSPHGRRYGSSFPVVDVRDIVRAQQRALEQLGITRLAGAMGGSLGGMQALSWALQYPQRLGLAVIIGAYDYFSAMGIALNAVAREAIYNDPNFANGDYYDGEPPREGLRLARMIAMLTYKSDALFAERHGRRIDRAGGDPARNPRHRYDIEGYLHRQGELLVARMDANTYLTLSRAMDLFDTRDTVIENTRPRLAFIGIESDWLFPARHVHEAAVRFACAGFVSSYAAMRSLHGHDAFLADTDELTALLEPVLAPTYAALPLELTT
jgi:homoserine O-acetyltransferase